MSLDFLQKSGIPAGAISNRLFKQIQEHMAGGLNPPEAHYQAVEEWRDLQYKQQSDHIAKLENDETKKIKQIEKEIEAERKKAEKSRRSAEKIALSIAKKEAADAAKKSSALKKQETEQQTSDSGLLNALSEQRAVIGSKDTDVEKSILGVGGEVSIRDKIQEFISKNKKAFSKDDPAGRAAFELMEESVQLGEDALTASTSEAKLIYKKLEFIKQLAKKTKGDQKGIADFLESQISPLTEKLKKEISFKEFLKNRAKSFINKIPENLTRKIPLIGGILGDFLQERREQKENLKKYSGALGAVLTKGGRGRQGLDRDEIRENKTPPFEGANSAENILESDNESANESATAGMLDNKNIPKKSLDVLILIHDELVKIRNLMVEKQDPENQELKDRENELENKNLKIPIIGNKIKKYKEIEEAIKDEGGEEGGGSSRAVLITGGAARMVGRVALMAAKALGQALLVGGVAAGSFYLGKALFEMFVGSDTTKKDIPNIDASSKEETRYINDKSIKYEDKMGAMRQEIREKEIAQFDAEQDRAAAIGGGGIPEHYQDMVDRERKRDPEKANKKYGTQETLDKQKKALEAKKNYIQNLKDNPTESYNPEPRDESQDSQTIIVGETNTSNSINQTMADRVRRKETIPTLNIVNNTPNGEAIQDIFNSDSNGFPTDTPLPTWFANNPSTTLSFVEKKALDEGRIKIKEGKEQEFYSQKHNTISTATNSNGIEYYVYKSDISNLIQDTSIPSSTIMSSDSNGKINKIFDNHGLPVQGGAIGWNVTRENRAGANPTVPSVPGNNNTSMQNRQIDPTINSPNTSIAKKQEESFPRMAVRGIENRQLTGGHTTYAPTINNFNREGWLRDNETILLRMQWATVV